eukprot:TRINITY_DN633_c0_g1_i1.p1 TRINITY_DN633_c0_g1~~TRINITY_DN633_c0_g1_i1.p1  ORF type:complete len:541 (+),score=103.62 TRINITY_DN633_c0_g1_i1:257-1879(+)
MGACMSNHQSKESAGLQIDGRSGMVSRQPRTPMGKDGKSIARTPRESRNGHSVAADDTFRRYTFEEISSATQCFAAESIVSEGGEDAVNWVYKGVFKVADREEDRAVKRLDTQTWPSSKQLILAAKKVGVVRHEALVGLLGVCVDNNERLLVCEYMPNGTVAAHLFHWESQPLPWSMRMRVALQIAKVLDYLGTVAGLVIYHDLNVYRIHFDKDWNPRLSCFGLIKNSIDGRTFSTNLAYAPPEYLKKGVLTVESVVYSFGMLLLDLLSGKHIPPSHVVEGGPMQAIELMARKNLVDSHLENNYPMDAALEVAKLVYGCLQREPEIRPQVKDIIRALEPLQVSPETPSRALMEFDGARPNVRPFSSSQNRPRLTPLSAFGVAASKGDFPTLRAIMLQLGYKEDENAQNELSFQSWQPGIQDWLSTRKRGDDAFMNGNPDDIKEALEHYSKLKETEGLVSPTVLARRCLCWLVVGNWRQALADGMAAQAASPDWPIPYYLQATALQRMESMGEDALDMLDRGAQLDANRSSPRQPYMMSGG